MKRLSVMLLVATFGFGGSFALAEDIDMEAAKTLFESKCSLCHATDRPLSKSKDMAQWKRTVERMAGKKPGLLTEEEADTIVKYLTKVGGK